MFRIVKVLCEMLVHVNFVVVVVVILCIEQREVSRFVDVFCFRRWAV